MPDQKRSSSPAAGVSLVNVEASVKADSAAADFDALYGEMVPQEVMAGRRRSRYNGWLKMI